METSFGKGRGREPTKKKARIEMGVENQKSDQIRADAHEKLDKADSFILITLNSDETVGRLLQSDEKDTMALIGTMKYQIHRLEQWLDSLNVESGDDDEDEISPV